MAFDDLVVPTLGMTPITVEKAGNAFQEDLAALGLRREAGKHRHRGGHDLRAWFITTCQEHGAHPSTCCHAHGEGDVVSGYTRASWSALCAEVGKLKVGILDGKLLELATGFATHEKRARNRWGKRVRAEGLEPSRDEPFGR
jgi:hypothetical protein